MVTNSKIKKNIIVTISVSVNIEGNRYHIIFALVNMLQYKKRTIIMNEKKKKYIIK